MKSDNNENQVSEEEQNISGSPVVVTPVFNTSAPVYCETLEE
ncbi:MAG: hypothetical protein WCH01_20550 [Methylococcaceae bacterium]